MATVIPAFRPKKVYCVCGGFEYQTVLDYHVSDYHPEKNSAWLHTICKACGNVIHRTMIKLPVDARPEEPMYTVRSMCPAPVEYFETLSQDVVGG